MNPRAFFEKLLKGFQAKGGGDATRFALRELIFGGTRRTYRHFAKQAQTGAVAKRRRIRKIAHESRRRNRAA